MRRGLRYVWTSTVCFLAAVAGTPEFNQAPLSAADKGTVTAPGTQQKTPGIDAELYQSTVAKAVNFMTTRGRLRTARTVARSARA